MKVKTCQIIRAFQVFLDEVLEVLDETEPKFALRSSKPEAAPEVEAAAEPEAEATPKKRGRKPKVAAAAIETAEPKTVEDADPDEDFQTETAPVETKAEPQVPTITAMELRNELVRYAQKTSKDKAYALLAKFGAKKVDQLAPEKYQAVYEALQADA